MPTDEELEMEYQKNKSRGIMPTMTIKNKRKLSSRINILGQIDNATQAANLYKAAADALKCAIDNDRAFDALLNLEDREHEARMSAAGLYEEAAQMAEKFFRDGL